MRQFRCRPWARCSGFCLTDRSSWVTHYQRIVMRRRGVTVGVPPRGVGGWVADTLDGRVDGRRDGRGPPDGNGRIQPVQTAKMAPPGETVTVGHRVVVPN